MTLKRTIKLLKEYLKMNNIIKLTDTAEPSSSERANKYRLDEINRYTSWYYRCSLTLIFTIGTGISKSLLKVTKKRKKKHNKIISLT